MSGAKKPHHSGSYPRLAQAVRDDAYANPATVCHKCKRTLAQHGREWQAGHVIDGLVDGPLAPECAECNARDGAARGNARRVRRVSRNWFG